MAANRVLGHLISSLWQNRMWWSLPKKGKSAALTLTRTQFPDFDQLQTNCWLNGNNHEFHPLDQGEILCCHGI
ncbi:hypothetical protein SAMN06265370_10581 [Puniceibacterium sediminis]|uniref:Uncharacterized protein n=1 Tax=Puniceibacterium sediminis TaxID=1608407 RepID=A0A238WBQ4_9RHOB|nr:hypothetical protein SAMN06265370_10581 [Puniceibacterium sediminis]